jgi:hypothetical protein
LTEPRIRQHWLCAWHEYSNVPPVSKRRSNVAPDVLNIAPLSNEPSFAVTVCVVSLPLNTQRTVSPGWMVSVFGS